MRHNNYRVLRLFLELQMGNVLSKDEKTIGPNNDRSGRFAIYYAPTRSRNFIHLEVPG